MEFEISNSVVEEYRPPKEIMDPQKPDFFLHEQEIQRDGRIKKVNTIFLTNRECPFKCVMCDLWRHTLDEPTPEGAIPNQIKYALNRLPKADVVKLYNSGNFFDGKAIPREDYDRIAELLSSFEHVIVENHPKLIGAFIADFRNRLPGSFEIAMGLESIHPDVLPRLNKQITKDDFSNAVSFLSQADISTRAFILLNPPFLTDEAVNIEWCVKSVNFAFDAGVSACSIIPTRDGNGIMDQLRKKGEYVPPKLSALETAFDNALKLQKGRVFCDVWDLEKFSNCKYCIEARKNRIEKMNYTQTVLPHVQCRCY